jgi:RecB family exonuclease
MEIRLRSSSIATADNCRRMLQYQYILNVETTRLSANLAFGRCVDVAVREYLLARTLDQPLPDLAARFQALWREEQAAHELVYNQAQSAARLERTGIVLVRAFPAYWQATGFEVAVSAQGEPLLDVTLSMPLGRYAGIDVILDGTPDMLAYTQEGELAIVDVKTATNAHTMRYTRRSDQLTTYQLLVSHHRERLGLPPVQRLSFMDFLKRRESGRIHPPVLVPPRKPAELAEFKQKCLWLAEDIKRQRFPRASRLQFNSPCMLCAFAQHCIYGDPSGLRFPADAEKRIA